MADVFNSFAELSRREQVGISYQLISRNMGSRVAIIAPHGGTIERGTTELAEAIAGEDWGLYSFSGIRKRGNYRNLHITSTRFDEPVGLKIVACSYITVAVHGCLEEGDRIYIGGLDDKLKQAIATELLRKGFSVNTGTDKFLGVNPLNICNRNRSGQGVQVELATEVRRSILLAKPEAIELGNSIRLAIKAETVKRNLD